LLSLKRGRVLALSAAWAFASFSFAAAAGAQEFEQRRPNEVEPKAPVPSAPGPQLTKAPVLKKNVLPVYPAEAYAEKREADVGLLIDIDASGTVTSATVAKSAGPAFDDAAVAAAVQLVFEPAEIDGKPGAIRIAYTSHFRLAAPGATDAAPAAEGASGTPRDSATAPVPGPDAPSVPPSASASAPLAGAPPAGGASAPKVLVQGTAKEKGTREPLAGADVSVIRRRRQADGSWKEEPAKLVGASDDQGAFTVSWGFDPLGPDEAVRVVVGDTNHEPCIHDFAASELGGAPASWECVAKPRVGRTYETRVRAPVKNPEATRTTLSLRELTTVPGTLGDPLRAIQSLPGVARSPYGLGLLVVRGAAPEDTGVFIDGQRVPALYHFLVGPSVLTPNMMERVDFYPGGFSVRYGRISGGAIDVTTHNSTATRLHGSVDVNLLDVSAYAEGPVGKDTAAAGAVRRSVIDGLLPLFVPKKRGSTYLTTVPIYWDYQARVDHRLGGGGHLAVVAFGSEDSLKVVAQDPDSTFSLENRIGFHRAQLVWDQPWQGWDTKLLLSYGYSIQDFNAGDDNHGLIRSHSLTMREELSRPLASWVTLAMGFDGILSFDYADFNAPYPRQGRTLADSSSQDRIIATRDLTDTAPAVWLETPLKLGSSWRVVPGVRGDHYHVIDTDKSSIDPRLAVRYTYSKSLAFKASAGLFHQLPTPQFLDKEFGNPNLGLIWADQYQLGVEKAFTEVIDLSLTGFLVRRHDLPVASVERFSSTGKGRSYGVETLLRHQVTAHFFGWVAYTLSRTEVTQGLAMLGGTQMAGMNVNNTSTAYQPSAYDETHNLIVVGSYRLASWELGGRYRLVSGRPETPVRGAFFDADFGGYTPMYGTTNSTRRATFSQLDLRIERTWLFDAWRFSAYLDVQNVTNAQNPEATVYDYRYQKSAPVRGLPILPVLGLKGRF
jgi:TonB family protein